MAETRHGARRRPPAAVEVERGRTWCEAHALQVDIAKQWLPTYTETFAQADDQTDKTFHFPDSRDWP